MSQGHEVQQAGKLGQGQAEAAPPTQLRPLQSPRSWCASRDLSVGAGAQVPASLLASGPLNLQEDGSLPMKMRTALKCSLVTEAPWPLGIAILFRQER